MDGRSESKFWESAIPAPKVSELLYAPPSILVRPQHRGHEGKMTRTNLLLEEWPDLESAAFM